MWKTRKLKILIFYLLLLYYNQIMRNYFIRAKEFILDTLFPKFCLNCGREGAYLCQDCFYLIDILKVQYCPFCFRPKPVFDGKTCILCRDKKALSGLFCASSYEDRIIKKIMSQFKREPYLKELRGPLAELIIAHFLNLEIDLVSFFNENTILIPVPIDIRKMRLQGFSQSEEIAKRLSVFLNIPVYSNVLIKIKNTDIREKNIEESFRCENQRIIKDKRILLIEDVFTMDLKMEESASVLKRSGAKEIWGVAVCRGL
ncbi:MAG: hypothetical protein PHI53_02835 [Candidatus Pacebacteria bacterium]|nr:hypothetical protein [Candidatus Paceibacterota bacterium]